MLFFFVLELDILIACDTNEIHNCAHTQVNAINAKFSKGTTFFPSCNNEHNLATSLGDAHFNVFEKIVLIYLLEVADVHKWFMNF